MNATDSILVPLLDAGGLSGLKGDGLGARYRFWRDADGSKHVFSVYPVALAPDYPDAIAVCVRRTPAGPIAMWAGPAGAAAARAAMRLKAEEIHLHVFGEDPAPGLRRLLEPKTSARSTGPALRSPVPALPRRGNDRHAA